MKKLIIAIVGESGVGKDTIARILNETYGFPIICSYTTRPKREGETDGIEHYFVSEYTEADRESTLAHTIYGGYDYWTSTRTLANGSIYVIDEKGLRDLMKRDDVELFKLYVTASEETRKARGVTQERMSRDASRSVGDKPICYDAVLRNDYEILHLKSHLRDVVNFMRKAHDI